MPIEIRELIIKATVAVDWENQSVTTVKEKKDCPKLPTNKEIDNYVMKYFRKNGSQKIVFDRAALSAFLIKWKDSVEF